MGSVPDRPLLPAIAAAIVTGSPDAILIADERGHVVEANPAALTLLGYQREGLLRLDLGDVVVADPQLPHAEATSLLQEDAWQGEVTVQTRDGRAIPVEASSRVITGPTGPLSAAFLRDLSARKRADQALQAASEAKGIFLDMMSHELRTPLHAVLGYAEYLLSQPKRALTGAQRADIGYIHRAGVRMISLINQALELSRQDAGRITLATEPIDLPQIIEEVRQDVAPQAAAKHLVLEIVVPPSLPAVLGDAERVRQILLNLVGNAVKFTDAGRVRLAVAPLPDGGVEVVVSDTGVGIAADALVHIFEPFYQVEGGVTRHHGGSGLGLAIASRLAEQMGGSLSVRSEPHLGTTFRLHLPES